MIEWFRGFLTSKRLVDEAARREVAALEERYAKRILVMEQKIEADEQAMLRLGQLVARIDGRTSLKSHESTEVR
jgi:CII-binding regulator of phage lambda lysogenization HflD